MYKQCRTEQSAQRQRELEQGLLKAMQKKHYDEISVSDLCQTLGVPRKAFYRYFSGMDGALYALIDHSLLDYETFELDESPSEDPPALRFMKTFFAYWKHHKILLDALQRSNLSGVLVQRSIDYSRQEDHAPRFPMGEEKDARAYVTMFTVCGLMSIVVQWHHDGYAQSIDQMARIALRLLSQPLFPDTEL